MAIASAAEVAEILGCGAGETAMLQLRDAAQAAIETYCDRRFDSAQWTEYHNGRGDSYLFVKNAPITDSAGAITRDSSNITVHDDVDREYDADALVDADDLVISDPDAGEVYYDGGTFLADIQNIKIVYYGGFTAATMPEDVKQAYIILIQEWWIHRSYRTDRTGGRGPLDMPTVPTAGSLPDQVRDLLSPWRRAPYYTGYEDDA